MNALQYGPMRSLILDSLSRPCPPGNTLFDVTPDAAMVRLEITPKRAGAIEGQLAIETATGTGKLDFVLFATTW